MVRPEGQPSFLERMMNISKDPAISGTFKEERKAKEKEASDFAAKREACKSKPLVATSENHPGFRDQASDEVKLVEKASKHLKEHLNELVGKGGYDVDFDEFRSLKAHNDKIDNSIINEKALISFAVNFMTGAKSKTAKFIVSFDESKDEKFAIENEFFVNQEKRALTSASLNAYLNESESDTVKQARAEKPLAFFNPELGDVGTYERVETKEPSHKVAARLKTAGYSITENFWIDACYGPKEFGRNCYFVEVPLGKSAEFKKFASMTDEEWTNRATDKSDKPKDWDARSEEKGGATKNEFKKGEDWAERTLEGGKEGKKKDYGNPYNSDAKMLASDASKKNLSAEATRKEAVKQAIASKDEGKKTIMDKLNELESLL